MSVEGVLLYVACAPRLLALYSFRIRWSKPPMPGPHLCMFVWSILVENELFDFLVSCLCCTLC